MISPRPCPAHLLPGTVLNSKNHGKFKIVKYVSTAEVHILFLKTGFESIVKKRSIEKSMVRDPLFPRVYGVGFVGVGQHSNKSAGGLAYRKWHFMLRRCYGSEFKSRGDAVCDEWKNFQNFAKWFNENNIKNKILINKDGESEYSPANSIFSERSNNPWFLTGEEHEIKSPSGEVFKVSNLAKFSRENGLSPGYLSLVVNKKAKQHKGWVLASMPEEERKALCVYPSNCRKPRDKKIEPVKTTLKQEKEEDRFKPRVQKIVPNELSETDVLLNKFFGIG